MKKFRGAAKHSDLVIDIGNTRIKIAMFVGHKLVEVLSFSNQSEREIKGLIEKSGAQRAILSAVTAVNPELHRLLTENFALIEVAPDLPLPIKIDYKTPQTLGTDRIANAVAAAKFYPATDVLIIDFGTCIKYDLVTKEGVYLGGAIAPGVVMRFRSMHEMTGKLPEVLHWETSDTSWPAKSTHGAMVAGVVQGIQGEMSHYIQLVASEFDHVTVIATGGDFGFFEKAFKNIIFAHPYLTLEGLHEILKFNIS